MFRFRLGILVVFSVLFSAFLISHASDVVKANSEASSIVVSAPFGDDAGGATEPYVSDQKPAAATIPIGGPQEKLYGGPYVTDVTPRSALVNWVLRGNSPAAGKADDASGLRGWRVLHSKITGLQPHTTYYYDVLRDKSAEGTGQFTTPPNSLGGFSFAVYGDTRSREDIHRQVAEKMAEQSPTFLINTGDLVADGNNARLWPGFFEAAKSLLRKTAFFPVMGNHDKNSSLFYQLFPHTTSYYSFDLGEIHFSVLNSEAPAQEWQEELGWLAHDLGAAASADFRFVVLHHTPYSAISKRQGAAQKLAAQVVPIFEKYHVDAVFSGHDHNYQRHLAGGIQYFVTGGGGAPLYDIDSPIPGITQKYEKIENFVLARVTGHECEFQAIDREGKVIDSVVMQAGAAKKPDVLPAAK